MLAVTSGGTIPDRGLYGVFTPEGSRVGELDEEMVYESRVGETFLLGASTWRIEEITHDRVLVTPAPGEPGKMPFWKGDRAGRPLELGLAIGRLMHDLLRLSPSAAIERLTSEHDLDRLAAENLLQYLRDQMSAARAIPDAATVVQRQVAFLTTLLTLTTGQVTQATTIFTAAINAITPLQTNIGTARTSLAAAIKSNATATIDQLSINIGTLTGQITAIDSKADAAFYALLTADQKAKLDQLGADGFDGHGLGGIRVPGGGRH